MDSAAQLPAFLCLAAAGAAAGLIYDVLSPLRFSKISAFIADVLSSDGGFVCADRHVLSSARFSVVRVFRDDGGIYNIFEKYAFSGCIFRKNVL